MRLILAGGGLANCLIAHRLSCLRPEVDWTILDAGEALGGNHTWSFHATDLTADQNRWMEPFLEARWSSYEVRFPAYRRVLPLGYRSASADRLRAVMAPLAAKVRTGAEIVTVGPRSVTLASGESLAGDAVIDGRGYRPSPHMRVAYQKFLGREIRTRAPHGLAHPVVMDGTVRQRDGYRFVYLLPFGPSRILIEDTYYSDRTELDAAAARDLIGRYAADQGWTVDAVLREETGVLPLSLGGDIEAFWAEAGGVAQSGLRAALFHPTTGYSLPDAVRLADRIASTQDLSAPALFELTRRHSLQRWRGAGFCRLLDRLLFQAAEPDERYKLLERFYRLPPGLIGRFYAGRSTPFDKLRVLSGKPPVPLGRALGCLPERPAAVARP